MEDEHLAASDPPVLPNPERPPQPPSRDMTLAIEATSPRLERLSSGEIALVTTTKIAWAPKAPERTSVAAAFRPLPKAPDRDRSCDGASRASATDTSKIAKVSQRPDEAFGPNAGRYRRSLDSAFPVDRQSECAGPERRGEAGRRGIRAQDPQRTGLAVDSDRQCAAVPPCQRRALS